MLSQFQDYRQQSMKWVKKYVPNQKKQEDQKYGCSFLKTNHEKEQFFLAKKIVSPPRKQLSIYEQNLRAMRSPKNISNKISLRQHNQKFKLRMDSEKCSLAESIEHRGEYVIPRRESKKTECFSQARSKQFMNYYYGSGNAQKVGSTMIEDCSQRPIKQLKFQGRTSKPVVSFYNPFTSEIHMEQPSNYKHYSHKKNFASSVQALSVKEQFQSERAESTLFPSQSEKIFNQEAHLNSTMLSNIKLPPQLNFFEDDCELDINYQIQQQLSHFPYTPQKNTQPASINTPKKQMSQKPFINDSITKLRSVQKMQDMEEIVSVFDSNASNDGDAESIVLGHLQQFQPSRNSGRPQGTNYQKAYSECDSISIFQ